MGLRPPTHQEKPPFAVGRCKCCGYLSSPCRERRFPSSGGPGQNAFEDLVELFSARSSQQCEANRVNDGYMPAVPRCNGDQIRQSPIRALACKSGRLAVSKMRAELPEKSATTIEPKVRMSRSSYARTRSYTPVVLCGSSAPKQRVVLQNDTR